MRRLSCDVLRCTTIRHHGLTPATAVTEYRRYCSELLLPFAGGASLISFSDFLSADRPVDTAAVTAYLQTLSDFRIEGDKIFLRTTAAVQQHREVIAQLAERLPQTGSPPADVRAILAELQPNFLPVAVGARSLREALEMFGDLIYVEPKERGMWVARPRQSTPQQEDPPAVALRRAMASCETAAKGDFLRLSVLTAATGKSLSAFFETPTREGIVRELQNSPSYRNWEWKFSLRVRPLPRPRGVHALVDGDGLGKDALAMLWSSLRCLSLHSTKAVVRQPASAPHTGNDIIAPPDVSTSMVVEAEADRLKLSVPVVLKDVVYFCGDHQFDLYHDEVSRRVAFPDANVLVCSRSKIGVVSERPP